VRRHCAGTAFVVDDEQRRLEEEITIDPNLKYDRNGAVPIILVPQPSDDPNDPLVGREVQLHRTAASDILT
jgi:hypothetical protein